MRRPEKPTNLFIFAATCERIVEKILTPMEADNEQRDRERKRDSIGVSDKERERQRDA